MGKRTLLSIYLVINKANTNALVVLGCDISKSMYFAVCSAFKCANSNSEWQLKMWNGVESKCINKTSLTNLIIQSVSKLEFICQFGFWWQFYSFITSHQININQIQLRNVCFLLHRIKHKSDVSLSVVISLVCFKFS